LAIQIRADLNAEGAKVSQSTQRKTTKEGKEEKEDKKKFL
jgi:hypothetical protein